MKSFQAAIQSLFLEWKCRKWCHIKWPIKFNQFLDDNHIVEMDK